MRTQRLRSLRLAIPLATIGTCLGIGGCDVGTVTHYISNFNPCVSILNCDPVTYRFITSGYEAPGADPYIDPVCTYPPFCPGDPFVSLQPTTTP